jgi:hypothetical protein
MNAKEHLTQAGLEKIISIKATLNLGLSEKLKLSFLHIIPIERPPFIISEEPLHPNWITGFSEGDCTFSFSITDKTIQAFYSIGLHSREKPPPPKAGEFFGSKSNVRVHGANSLQFTIGGTTEINTVLIPHFINYPLYGNKLFNFNLWVKK